MPNEISPQLQQILDNFGRELQSFISEEVSRQLNTQRDINGTAEPADEPPLRLEPEPREAVEPDLNLPQDNVQQEQIEQYQPEQYQSDINDYQPVEDMSSSFQSNEPSSFNSSNGLSDYDKMFGVLARVKNKHTA